MPKFGLNFRATVGFVADGTDQIFVDIGDDYPTSRGGLTFGWVVEGSSSITEFDSNAGLDPRVAGSHRHNSNVEASIRRFRIDAPTGAPITIRAAFGDALATTVLSSPAGVYDDTTLVQALSGSANVEQFIDASSVVRTSAADWIANNASIQHTFSGPLYIKVFDVTAFKARISHFEIEIPVIGTAALVASDAVVSASGAVKIIASALAITASDATVDAHGAAADVTGGVTMIASDAVITGAGTVQVIGQPLTLIASDAIVAATGAIKSAGAVAMVADDATMSMVGTAVSDAAQYVPLRTIQTAPAGAVAGQVFADTTADFAGAVRLDSFASVRTVSDADIDVLAATNANVLIDSINANASGIVTLDSRVDVHDSSITAVTTQSNALNSQVNDPSTGLAATASVAVDAQTRVAVTEGEITDIHAQWGVVVDVNGRVTGAIRLDAGLTESTFDVLVDKFRVFNGTTDEAVFQVIGGVVLPKGGVSRVLETSANSLNDTWTDTSIHSAATLAFPSMVASRDYLVTFNVQVKASAACRVFVTSAPSLGISSIILEQDITAANSSVILSGSGIIGDTLGSISGPITLSVQRLTGTGITMTVEAYSMVVWEVVR